RVDNGNSYRTGEALADDGRRRARGPRAHVRVSACRRAAVDAGATRRLRTGCDAALPTVRPGRRPCQGVHGPLPSLPQPPLPCLVRGRREEETLLSDSSVALSPRTTPLPGALLARPRARGPSPSRSEVVGPSRCRMLGSAMRPPMRARARSFFFAVSNVDSG